MLITSKQKEISSSFIKRNYSLESDSFLLYRFRIDSFTEEFPSVSSSKREIKTLLGGFLFFCFWCPFSDFSGVFLFLKFRFLGFTRL